ncbi:hypothetical protein [Halorubellus sp. JP-L1]|uniref:hypothetical protein n=1 Tax=Halorubellus sp. JP-L1 TaxID=2715753 RepID=UPI001878C5F2|nr:hypothetical protein [Halorubellus sp. JP-L1]
MYRRLDEWAWGLSRLRYALLTGVVAAVGSIAVSVAFGSPSYVFALGIGIALAVLNYLSDPNRTED